MYLIITGISAIMALQNVDATADVAGSALGTPPILVYIHSKQEWVVNWRSFVVSTSVKNMSARTVVLRVFKCSYGINFVTDNPRLGLYQVPCDDEQIDGEELSIAPQRFMNAMLS
jgi:hypothetical protein